MVNKFCYVLFCCFFILVLTINEFKSVYNTYTHKEIVHNRNYALPYCNNNEHVAGFWEKSKSNLNKTFYCCEWFSNDNKNLCGNFMNYPFTSFSYIGSNDFYSPSGGNACLCDANNPLGRDKINEREMYEWKPAYCDLLEWNATQFCYLLGNRTIALIGDSTMEQTAATLMNMIKTGNGGCAHQIRLCRTDSLVVCPKDKLNAMEYVEVYKPNIAVFTHGAHAYSMDEIESVWNSFIPMLIRMKQIFPEINLIWKSQNTGHVHCVNHKNSRHHPNLIYDPIHDNHKYDKYKWYNFPGFDEVSRNYTLTLHNKYNISMKFIDMSPLNFRIDAHATPIQDCLHYCLPGPINLFSILLLQMLYNRELD